MLISFISYSMNTPIKTKTFYTSLIFVVIFFLVFPADVYAYLDLGSGSYIIQVLFGTLLGSIFAIKVYWKNIKTMISNLFSKEKKVNEQEDSRESDQDSDT